MQTSRLEAFSDGVFAIAITLLVIEVRVPHAEDGELAHALVEQWPSYAAYAISFAVIGIMWVNHHALMDLVARVDRPLLFLNLMLLMFIAFMPFSTALLAEHLVAPSQDAHVAAAVYSGNGVLNAIGFNVIWRYIVRDARLLQEHLDVAQLRTRTRRFSLGLVIYPLTVALSFVSAPLTLGVHAAIAAYYVVDQLTASPTLSPE
ncbi:MAG: TMEM175 family protein [Actinomycetota bacterium]